MGQITAKPISVIAYKTNDAKVYVQPRAAVSYLPEQAEPVKVIHVTLHPLACVTFASSIPDTSEADLARSTAFSEAAHTDASRSLGRGDVAAADDVRQLVLSGSAASDLASDVRNRSVVNGEALRRLSVHDAAFIDAKRTITAATHTETSHAVLQRVVHASDAQEGDSTRRLWLHVTSDTPVIRAVSCADGSVGDALRSARRSDVFYADLSRVLPKGVRRDTCEGDTSCSVRNLSSMDFCTFRNVQKNDANWYDLFRQMQIAEEGKGDTDRQIPYVSTSLHPASISISLQKGTLSDTFQMVAPYDLPLRSMVSGRLLDFPYHFLVYETNGTGLMRTITGMYDVDKLLYTPFTYKVPRRYYSGSEATAKSHARAIAKTLSKDFSWHCDDFVPESSYEGMGATVQNIVSGLFGWAGNLPQVWINVFLREDTLYVVQRGHEPHTIDVTGTKHTRPNIDKRFMRSVWSGTGTFNRGGAHGSRITIEPMGYTGTIKFGAAEVQYRFGLVVREVMATSRGDEVTTYSYDTEGYIKSKETDGPDRYSVTTYSYATWSKFLASEYTETLYKDTNQVETDLVQHVYLGNGWYGTATYHDGYFQSASVSSGKPGGPVNRYVMDESNLNLGAGYKDSGGGSFVGAALFDTEFPIKDEKTLKKLTRAIEWLNHKTEERITMDIWQYPHLIDFTDKVVYEGHTYFLESNEVSRTPTELKQTIQIVRWY